MVGLLLGNNISTRYAAFIQFAQTPDSVITQVVLDPGASVTVSLFNPFLPPGSGSIEDLDVDLIITTTNNGTNHWADLDIDLEHVNTGTVVRLFNFVTSANSGGLLDVIFDDEAGTSIQTQSGGGTTVGSFSPFEALSAFDGELWGGTWDLAFADQTGFTNESLLIQWSLHAQIPEPGTIALMGLGLLGFAARRRV